MQKNQPWSSLPNAWPFSPSPSSRIGLESLWGCRASVLGRDPGSFLWGGVADGAAGRWCQEAHDVWLAQCMRVFLNANSFSGAHVLQVAPVSPPSHLFTRTCCCSIFCLISWHSFLLLALQEPLINTNPKILMSYRQGNRGK